MEGHTSDPSDPVKETQRTQTPPESTATSPRPTRGEHRLRGHSHLQRGKRNIHNSRANKRPTAAAKGVDGDDVPQDYRTRTEEARLKKRQKRDGEGRSGNPFAATFTSEEISQEERRPKRKVAVMIGYAGSGYKGMQLNEKEKTIEGDLFAAFVAAGAISKANADDPRKSSLVRCARTDKGVHAAGNVISLKLIIEEPDVVARINAHLSPQIRVWGIERTQSSFSCYQLCDSRVYEYLIPSYCLLPPHPESQLGKKLVEIADKEGDSHGLAERQKEVAGWWAEAEETYIKPVLDGIDEEVREEAQGLIHSEEVEPPEEGARKESVMPDTASSKPQSRAARLTRAVRALRTAYRHAQSTFRLPPARLARLTSTLALFTGTHSFHNYTVGAYTYHTPSSQRHIKSFAPTASSPFLISTSSLPTEWLSLKVHGQSFMTHQIRKMVSAAVLLTRCGGPAAAVIPASYTNVRLAIPKAPGLGLLLERPVFETYNRKIRSQPVVPGQGGASGEVGFEPWEEQIREFKEREIYRRVYEGENEGGQGVFEGFFGHVDGFKGGEFLWVSSGGVGACRKYGEVAGKRRREGGERGGFESEDEEDGERVGKREDG